MLCRRPFMAGLAAHGCGQCMPCRVNRRRLWSHRLLLESFKHSEACFVTLTYADEHLPPSGSVSRKAVQGFLKRLRDRIHPRRIRFYAVGEYGELTQRPHYHLALFGIGPVEASDLVPKAWPFGGVHIGDLSPASASYLARYVTKKWTRPDEPGLAGRSPEFATMSLKPGIGAEAMADVAAALSDRHGQELVAVDVPTSLRSGPSSLLLGRYLRSQLRVALGRSPDTPVLAKAQWLGELQAMLEEAGSYEAYRAKVGRPQACLSLETRARVFAQKATL